MPTLRRPLLAAIVLSAAFLALYADVLARLVRTWAADGNYSHGFLIVPLALLLAWRRRHELALAERRPSAAGLGVLLVSLAMFVLGVLGAELFLTRISMLGVVAGATLFVLGWRPLRIIAFPLALVLLAIPIPEILFNQVAFPLQLLASRFGETALWLANVPVLREGNVITLAHVRLEVAEACSGIRSLMALVSLAVVYGYFVEPRNWSRVALAVAAVPIAIVANGLRIAGTGLLAQRFGVAAAEGFFHEFSGWLVFLVAALSLVAVHRALRLVQTVSVSHGRAPAPPVSDTAS